MLEVHLKEAGSNAPIPDAAVQLDLDADGIDDATPMAPPRRQLILRLEGSTCLMKDTAHMNTVHVGDIIRQTGSEDPSFSYRESGTASPPPAPAS